MWLASDFDGTLNNGDDHSISQELQNYLIRLDKLGVKIFFASGRNLNFLRKIAKKINVIPFIIAAENGGHIWDQKTGEHLFSGIEDLEKFRSQVDKIECSDYEDELKYSIWTRCYSLESAGEAAAKIQNLVINNGWNLKVFLHPSGCVDVVPTGITKSNVSLFLTQAKYDIHYFGDGFNDLSLMMLDSVTPHTGGEWERRSQISCQKKRGISFYKKIRRRRGRTD